MKLKDYFFGFLFLNTVCYSQQTKFLYYIEFKDPNNKPKTIWQDEQSKILSFDNYKMEVRQYDESFSSFTSQKLKNTSFIEFKSENDYIDFTIVHKNSIVKSEKIDVRNEDILLNNIIIKNSAPKNIDITNVSYLYTPNDYYLHPEPIAHSHLDLINAREAWDYSKGDNVIVGISDTGFLLTHQEFANKISTIPGQTVINDNIYHHGNVV